MVKLMRKPLYKGQAKCVRYSEVGVFIHTDLKTEGLLRAALATITEEQPTENTQ